MFDFKDVELFREGVKYGFEELDRNLFGLENGELIVIGGIPSVGKSAFLLQMALNAAVEQHLPVAFISPENSCAKICENAIVQRTGLSRFKWYGKVKLEQFELVEADKILLPIKQAPLFIDDTPGLDIKSLRCSIYALLKEHDIKVVYIDCIQLINASDEYKGNREQEVGEVSRSLKAMAKEFNIPIVATSRLSRNIFTKTGGMGKPQLRDLRESGSIEHDADIVIFIHRPDFVGMSEVPEDRKKTQFIIAKNKNGDTFTVDARWEEERISFVPADISLDGYVQGPVASAANYNFEDQQDF